MRESEARDSEEAAAVLRQCGRRSGGSNEDDFGDPHTHTHSPR